MRVRFDNYILDIYKTRAELWIDNDQPFVTNIEVYNLEETILQMKLKFSQEVAERIYSSLLLFIDNPFCDNNNVEFDKTVESIGISLPLFELNYTYDIIVSRDNHKINLHLIKKNLNGTNSDIILIQMKETDISIFANLIYDQYETLL